MRLASLADDVMSGTAAMFIRNLWALGATGHVVGRRKTLCRDEVLQRIYLFLCFVLR